jgi:colanic acid/amylovoran biosynthesis glycosyltransferase
MKLAYLLKKFPRLSETFILTEVLAQEALGTELHIFSRRAPDDEPRHPELAGLKAQVEVFPKYNLLDPWSALFATGEDALESDGWSHLRDLVQSTAALVGERFPRLVAEALHLRQRSRELGIEHLHVHFATESAIVALLSKELGGPSFSITAHAKDIYRNTVPAALLERLIVASSFLVTVCDANVDYLRERLSTQAGQNVRRLYNGLALERFAFKPTRVANNKILGVGRLVEKKGFDILIQALALLKQAGRSFSASIAGGGDDELELKAQAEAAGLSPAELHFTGPLDQDGIRALMAEATLFCLPCVVGADGNRDALPTVLLEALAMGLPCISTPVTGIPEILEQGLAGRIVPERDPVATAEALGELLDNPEERAQLAARGRARVEQIFDASQSGSTLNQWFMETLAASSAQ